MAKTKFTILCKAPGHNVQMIQQEADSNLQALEFSMEKILERGLDMEKAAVLVMPEGCAVPADLRFLL